ncbi:MAG: hypothetical protein K2X01_09125 [Cyanobacteria bacterium]|nr:hypothetical protein [Cyanobacteriota bacterium]
MPPVNASQVLGRSLSAEEMRWFDIVSRTEMQLYGHSYWPEELTSRVDRIEKSLNIIPAQPNGQNPQAKPGHFFHRSSASGVSILPSVLMSVRIQRLQDRLTNTQEAQIQNNVMPVLAYLERKLFQQSSSGQTINERLKRLENHVFGRTFEKYPTEVRVKKLTYTLPVLAKEVRLSGEGAVIGSSVMTSKNISHAVLNTATMQSLSVDTVPDFEKERDRPSKETMLSKENNTDTEGVPSRSKSLLSAPPDYAAQLYLPSGKAFRWHRSPVKIYLKDPAGDELRQLTRAVNTWGQAQPMIITPQENDADIVIGWHFPQQHLNKVTGSVVHPVLRIDTQRAIRAVLLIDMSVYALFSEEQQLHGLLHQIGHGLGMFGHSDQPGDLMYPALPSIESRDFPARWNPSGGAVNAVKESTKLQIYSTKPSLRDVATLKKWYSLPAVDIKMTTPP